MKTLSNQLKCEKIVSYKYKDEIIQVRNSVFNLDWMNELNIYPKIIFDVGCNDGGDSIRFKQKWKNAEVYAFEANPYITKEIENYMVYEGINLIKAGVLDKDGYFMFYPGVFPKGINKKNAPWGTYLENNKNNNYLDPELVKTISLYLYCKENGIKEIDLLHVDVEGSELNVMVGLKNIKAKVIFIEQNPSFLSKDNIINFNNYMEQQDYVLLNIYNDIDYLYINKRLYEK